MATLILMAPMQIRKSLSIGGIYDLLLCDFYAKVNVMQGREVFFPLLMNVNGSPIEKLLPEQELSRSDIFDIAGIAINNILDECALYHINFDMVFRDDSNIQMIRRLLPEKATLQVNTCPKCGSIYGTDFSITACRRCGAKLNSVFRNTFAIHANSSELMDKINHTNFVHKAAKTTLVDYINNLPLNYDIVLERNRRYSTVIDGTCIDPRLTAISLLPRARQNFTERPQIVHVHGNVIKKFTYYAFAFLSDDDIPDIDFMHGNVVDLDGKKIRNSSTKSQFCVEDFGINERELRAFFLSSSAQNDIVIDANLLKGKKKSLVKFFVLANRIREERNYQPGTSGVRESIQARLNNFYRYANSWNLPVAFNEANEIIHDCWKIVKDSKLTEEEVTIVDDLQSIYFG